MRSFTALALTALFCLATSGARAAVMTVVPAAGATAGVPVYIARPPGEGPFPAVLLLHGCEGFNGLDAVAADRLALRGYVGVAIDSLGASRPRGACTDRTGSTDEAAAARATLAWLRTQPYVASDRLAVIGFSMGGNAVFDIVDPATPNGAAPAGLRAAVAFYPWCDGHDGKVTVPLEIFDGDADRVTPSAPCAAIAQAGKAAGKPIDITVYPGATHGFQIPGPDRSFYGQPIHFDPTAAADSAQKVEQFLATQLK